ncbi:hypothetical protein [Runella sp.]|uniref:hypothetical protein n=1 Tax=Runella sp. TaxID=1960881 RepID=UPI003D13CDBE
MRNLRICIYGGTDLQGASPHFTSELTHTILKTIPGCIIITGGFLHSSKKPHAKSTDSAALEGAKRYAAESNTELKKCFEAWIPEPNLDKRQEVEGVKRMDESQGITVRVMQGKTPLGRRLAMVAGVDFVLTISGKRHTEVVVEQALELGIPVLPIPDFGGDSQELLRNYRERIKAAFEPNKFDNCLKMLSKELKNKEYAKAANAVIDLIGTAKLGKCLILLPYDEKHNELYISTIEPWVAKHMIPVRLDLLPGSESIYTNFAEAIRSSLAVIADITVLKDNVMYEVGYAHGLGLTPLIYTQDKNRLEQLPVYLRTLNVQIALKDEDIKQLIDDYLSSVKKKKKSSWL